MMGSTPEEIVRHFNEYINARDINGLESMMSEDHIFIDTANNKIAGREACLAAWRDFFSMFPDYRNTFEEVAACQGQVCIHGHSTCADPRLDGPALWSAKVLKGQVTEWRVYEDTAENRRRLNL